MKSAATNSKVSPCLRIFIEALFEESITGTPSPDQAVSGGEFLVNAGWKPHREFGGSP